MERNTEEEQKKATDDDILMWRGLMLFIAHEEMRKALKRGEEEAMFPGPGTTSGSHPLHARGGRPQSGSR